MTQSCNTAGRIIILNGPSSSGKTSIAQALQDILAEPHFYIGVDDALRMLPKRFRDWSKAENNRAVYKAISGFHHAIAALAAASRRRIDASLSTLSLCRRVHTLKFQVAARFRLSGLDRLGHHDYSIKPRRRVTQAVVVRRG